MNIILIKRRLEDIAEKKTPKKMQRAKTALNQIKNVQSVLTSVSSNTEIAKIAENIKIAGKVRLGE